MMTTFVIMTGLKEQILRYVAEQVPLNATTLALTARERWKATGNLNPSIVMEQWLILIGVIAIIILTAILLVISFRRITQSKKAKERSFFEHAQKSGLSERECQILLLITAKAGLKRSEAIFTMPDAFDLGVTKIIEESLMLQGAGHSQQLQTELAYLREKLGFQKQSLPSTSSTMRTKKLSSRQIPVGKKLHIMRRKARDSQEEDIESTVMENNSMGLAIQLPGSLESAPGDLWRIHYYFGTSVWEFDTSVVSCNGNIMVLNHSDNVRFINRRRFLRVSVNKPAFIALFPFAKTFVERNGNGQNENKNDGSRSGHPVTDFYHGSWKPPEFVPATITDLAGPGLCIESTLHVQTGDRILVAFKLDEEKQRASNPSNGYDKITTFKVIEDIGEVRHTKIIQNGVLIAVELIGLSDSDINELIRATNAVSVITNPKDRNTPDSAGTETHTIEPAMV